MAEVVIDRVTKRFGDVEAVKDVSLTVPRGELVVLLGPTGAGKTTLLRLVAGLEKPDAGAIEIDGSRTSALPIATRCISPPERRVAGFASLWSMRTTFATRSTRLLISVSATRRAGARSGNARLS